MWQLLLALDNTTNYKYVFLYLYIGNSITDMNNSFLVLVCCGLWVHKSLENSERCFKNALVLSNTFEVPIKVLQRYWLVSTWYLQKCKGRRSANAK